MNERANGRREKKRNENIILLNVKFPEKAVENRFSYTFGILYAVFVFRVY